MLIQYTPLSSLDQSAKMRLAAMASGLMQTTEAQRGYVMFEGKYFSTAEVNALSTSAARQFLSEG